MDGLQVCAPLRFGDVSLILVQRARLVSELSASSAHALGCLAPYAVVLVEADGRRHAFGADGAEIGLDELARGLPELADALARTRGS